MPDTPLSDLEDENRKLRAEVRALIHQRGELQEEIKAQRWFVRQCAAVFAAVDNLKPQHAGLYATEKSRPLASLPCPPPVIPES